LQIDHIGIVVKDIEASIEQWRTMFGYEPSTSVVHNTRQRVLVVFLDKPGSIQVKLVQPVDDDSPAAGVAQRGGGLHHLCFYCEDLDAELARLVSVGGRVLAAPQPGEAFDGERIAFVFARRGLNIELIETKKRAARLVE
jgi:methylmalonyl-CoA/ethylmalonyl-CoA epimerase